MPTNQILQIIPAVGWFAAFKMDDGRIELNPLAYGALTEDSEGHRSVDGHWGGEAVDGAECCSNFVGYFMSTVDAHAYLAAVDAMQGGLAPEIAR